MGLFEETSYKSYLTGIAEERGAKAAWADAIGCQRGYITAVLGGNAHLSLEQGEKLAKFLVLNEEEQDYFLMLVQAERAGTPSLEAHFRRKLDDARERRNQLRHRYKDTRTLTLEQRLTFYSSWQFGAIHMCIFIGLRDREAIGRALGLPVTTVSETIEFLITAGFIEEKPGGELVGKFPQTFLAGDSPMITKHHLNWRMRALQSVEMNRPEDLHYSSVFSVNKKDLGTLRAQFLEAIDRFKKTVGASTEETEVCSLTVDLFSLFG